MRTGRFTPAHIWTIAQASAGSAVCVRPEGSDHVLPVYVSENEIHTILVELTHILAPRPMVHELLLSVIESLKARLERVEIYGIRSGTYLSRLILRQGSREIAMEARPADVLCLSARTECPIWVDNLVLELNGLRADQIAAPTESETPSILSFLQNQLAGALAAEEYERAAILRDRLHELERALPSALSAHPRPVI